MSVYIDAFVKARSLKRNLIANQIDNKLCKKIVEIIASR